MNVVLHIIYAIFFIFFPAVAELSKPATANMAGAVKERTQIDDQGNAIHIYIMLFLLSYKCSD